MRCISVWNGISRVLHALLQLNHKGSSREVDPARGCAKENLKNCWRKQHLCPPHHMQIDYNPGICLVYCTYALCTSSPHGSLTARIMQLIYKTSLTVEEFFCLSLRAFHKSILFLMESRWYLSPCICIHHYVHFGSSVTACESQCIFLKDCAVCNINFS